MKKYKQKIKKEYHFNKKYDIIYCVLKQFYTNNQKNLKFLFKSVLFVEMSRVTCYNIVE